MGKSKVIGFNADKWEKDLIKYWVGQQNARLIAYAKEKIQEIGNRISSYHSRHHMDDTGNLLDSLCWGVSYDGKPIASGFYRSQKATQAALMHGWSLVEFREGSGKQKWDYENKIKNPFSEMHAGESVWGHQRAAEYLERAGAKSKAGQWKVFFAILAPYWGYWEKGFNMKLPKGGTTFLRFWVMAETYDTVKGELKPMRTSLRVHVDKYASKSLYKQAKRNLKNA
jgi:hypothetical protein